MFDKLVRASAALLPLCASAGAFAQAYPSRPVRIVVPFDLGAPDTVGRPLAQGLATQTGGSFVVENKPGANGIIGTQAVASAAPDGHTLLVVSTSIVVNHLDLLRGSAHPRRESLAAREERPGADWPHPAARKPDLLRLARTLCTRLLVPFAAVRGVRIRYEVSPWTTNSAFK
jgi:hypothetical protein